MSVLIIGMEMPKERESFTVTIKYNGLVFDTETGIQVAEAQKVPPHGSLIEKNAVFELIQSFPNVDRQLPVEFMKALYELPTILEAEEGET